MPTFTGPFAWQKVADLKIQFNTLSVPRSQDQYPFHDPLTYLSDLYPTSDDPHTTEFPSLLSFGPLARF